MNTKELITISVNEYKNLREIKQQYLNRLQIDIKNLQTKMLSDMMSAVIMSAIHNTKK